MLILHGRMHCIISSLYTNLSFNLFLKIFILPSFFMSSYLFYLISLMDFFFPPDYRRGLSKFYNGKSQSFTSLSNARSLEDLAKPGRPCRKKLKSSMSCGGDLDRQKSLSPKGCCKTTLKKASRGSLFSLGARSRPPIPPQKSSNFSSHNLLFA